MTTTPTRTLNQSQLRLLSVIYKFRYATPELLAHYLHVSPRSINFSLARLRTQGYVARRYDTHYRMHGKPAQYYVTSRSLRQLKTLHELEPSVVRARYKDGTLSDLFITHNINVFRLAVQVRASYPDSKLYTRSETISFNFFPTPRPDLYVVSQGNQEFFIDCFEERFVLIIKKRIDNYVRHYRRGVWRGQSYPGVVLIVPNPRLVLATRAYIAQKLEMEGIDSADLSIQASETIPAL